MLGDNIRKFRKKTGYSQEQIAEILGVSRQSISLWENNQTQPSLDNIVALAKTFNVTTDELLNEEAKDNTVVDTGKKQESVRRVKPWVFGVATSIVVVIVALICLWPWFSDIGEPLPFSSDLTAIEKAESSVVKVYCYDHKGQEIATGSGIVLFHNDMVVTNYHVIEGVYAVKISTDQDITYEAVGVWHQNERQDIAILKIEGNTDLEPLPIGDPSLIKKGEMVTAIGSPLGIKNTVSKGNLSARVMQDGYDILQFTAPISNGSSGGALFNEKGEVIGVTYASFVEGQNLNLAIPIDLVEKLYQSRSLSIAAKSFEDTYWLQYPEEYFFLKYGNPIKVTFAELKNNPEKYKDKMVQVEGYVSSVETISTLRMGVYITAKEKANDVKKDQDAYLNSAYTEHNLIYVFVFWLVLR